eukprot:743425-Pleurochrysis_carterae.AAC.1
MGNGALFSSGSTLRTSFVNSISSPCSPESEPSLGTVRRGGMLLAPARAPDARFAAGAVAGV